MKIEQACRTQIISLLVNVVTKKLRDYKPETDHKPFHYRLLGKDRYAVFSFIHSINTSLGSSIWEQTAGMLAQSAGYKAKHSFKLLGNIDDKTAALIDNLHRDLRETKRDADKKAETKEIRNAILPSIPQKHPDSTVDFFIIIDGVEYYFDLKTAKPNVEGFAQLKRKLLNWTALRLSQDRDAKVVTGLAIPYNPYHPAPYERWTLKGMFDLKGGEILVQDDFWNFVGGGDVYEDLLEAFQEAGEHLGPEIDKRFSNLK